MTTRRRFLVKCSVLTATAALAPMPGRAAPSRRLMSALDRIRFQDFSACVGTKFRVLLPRIRDVRLELLQALLRPTVAADIRIGGMEDAANERFSLTFRGSLDKPLVQDSYTFLHGHTGQFQLFIVPVIAKDKRHRYYEAVFNRPQTGASRPTEAKR